MVRITKQSLHDPGKERRVIIRKHKQSLSQNAYSPVEGLDQSSILKPYPSLGKGIPVQLSLPISLPVSPKKEKQTNKQTKHSQQWRALQGNILRIFQPLNRRCKDQSRPLEEEWKLLEQPQP